jgi:hypothetical protein
VEVLTSAIICPLRVKPQNADNARPVAEEGDLLLFERAGVSPRVPKSNSANPFVANIVAGDARLGGKTHPMGSAAEPANRSAV